MNELCSSVVGLSCDRLVCLVLYMCTLCLAVFLSVVVSAPQRLRSVAFRLSVSTGVCAAASCPPSYLRRIVQAAASVAARVAAQETVTVSTSTGAEGNPHQTRPQTAAEQPIHLPAAEGQGDDDDMHTIHTHKQDEA